MEAKQSWIVIEFNEVRGQVYDLLADLKYVEFDPVLWDMLLYQLSEYGTQGIAFIVDAFSDHVDEYGADGEEDLELILEAVNLMWQAFTRKMVRLFGPTILGKWHGYEIESTGRDIRVIFSDYDIESGRFSGFERLAGIARARMDSRPVPRPRTQRPAPGVPDVGRPQRVYRRTKDRPTVARDRTRIPRRG